MGLLLPHKRKLKIFPDMLTLSLSERAEKSGGGKRGDIEVFSAESRFRLFRLIHQLEFKQVTFCTLTYPIDFPTEARVYKAHLKEYRRRFEARYGKIKGVWRLEYQKRGAPHYHIMYLDCPFIPILDWCSLWSDVIHTSDANHRKIGVDIKLITGGQESKLVAHYLAKYVAKLDNRISGCVAIKPGRWWGKWNIEPEPPIEIELIDYQAEILVNALLDARKVKGWEPADYSLCSVLGETMGTGDFRAHAVKAVLEILKPDRDVIHL